MLRRIYAHPDDGNCRHTTLKLSGRGLDAALARPDARIHGLGAADGSTAATGALRRVKLRHAAGNAAGR
jgi:hypothetical protein